MEEKKGEFIDTIAGRAKFVRVETEDAQGRWNNNYYTRDGYWVTHHSPKHYVYKISAEDLKRDRKLRGMI